MRFSLNIYDCPTLDWNYFLYWKINTYNSNVSWYYLIFWNILYAILFHFSFIAKIRLYPLAILRINPWITLLTLSDQSMGNINFIKFLYIYDYLYKVICIILIVNSQDVIYYIYRLYIRFIVANFFNMVWQK